MAYLKVKYRIWNKYILMWWYRLWIRQDENHKSLDMDWRATVGMDEKGIKKYFLDLSRRRDIAHERDKLRE